tara:strand:- start:183 stop:746 length:564 start_codon:yes stop_codon:yes gene_type:complete
MDDIYDGIDLNDRVGRAKAFLKYRKERQKQDEKEAEERRQQLDDMDKKKAKKAKKSKKVPAGFSRGADGKLQKKKIVIQKPVKSQARQEAEEAISLMKKALRSGINYMDEGSPEQQANEAIALMRLATMPKPKKKLPPFYVPPNEEGVKCWTLLNGQNKPYTTCVDKKTGEQLRKDYTSYRGEFKFA